jgi:AcrR family transcriptional regulator
MVRAMSLRERQREATREQIIGALNDVLAEEHPASLSMVRVAERAGTSLRTVYRYFPTKEALVDAAAEMLRVPVTTTDGHLTIESLPDYLTAQWAAFGDATAAVRAQHLTPAGRELRSRRLPRSRRAVRAALRGAEIALPEEDEAKLVDLLVAMSSSSIYLELVDRLGYPADEAARLAAWGIAAAVDRARREGSIGT